MELFDLNNVSKQMIDTVTDTLEMYELTFQTKSDDNSCSIYCDNISDYDFERRFGNGSIEFKYSNL